MSPSQNSSSYLEWDVSRRMGIFSYCDTSVLLAIGRNIILSFSNLTILWHNLSGLDDNWIATWEHTKESLLSFSRPGEGIGGGDLQVKVTFKLGVAEGKQETFSKVLCLISLPFSWSPFWEASDVGVNQFVLAFSQA